jgi:hypothetical protein
MFSASARMKVVVASLMPMPAVNLGRVTNYYSARIYVFVGLRGKPSSTSQCGIKLSTDVIDLMALLSRANQT